MVNSHTLSEDSEERYQDSLIVIDTTSPSPITIPISPIRTKPGKCIRIQFKNSGKPLTLTISSKSAEPFTESFYHKIYIFDTSLFKIQIRDHAASGTFDLALSSHEVGISDLRLGIEIIAEEGPLPCEKTVTFSEFNLSLFLTLTSAVVIFALLIITRRFFIDSEYLTIAAVVFMILTVLGLWILKK